MKLEKVQHIGITVSNLERSLKFYRELTDSELLLKSQMRGSALARATNLQKPEMRFCHLKIENTILELIEYQNPVGRANERTIADAGFIHIGFELADVRRKYDELLSKGYEFTASPHTFSEEDGSPEVVGATFVYLKDPDNNFIELVQAPEK